MREADDSDKKAFLVLEDGTILRGRGFGAEGLVYGEVVFTTAMTGYTKSLTDPSYEGQILIMSYPLIGNYGVPSEELTEFGIPIHRESERIHVKGLVISKLMRGSHWSSCMSLDKWLRMEGVPGIEGIDTRALVKRIRERGVMMGALSFGGPDPGEVLQKVRRMSYEEMNLVERVTPRRVIVHRTGSKLRAVVVDCGVKYGIVRELLRRGVEVVRTPCWYDPVDALERFGARGVVLSNGPGNPSLLEDLVRMARTLVEEGIPTLGICLGNQILALADGGEVFKLKYGHRGVNKPVRDLKSGKAFVTAQNHGYAVSPESLGEFRVWMINIDDGSVEGICHPEKPLMAVQFHPEGSPGPLDSTWIFDLFSRVMRDNGEAI